MKAYQQNILINPFFFHIELKTYLTRKTTNTATSGFFLFFLPLHSSLSLQAATTFFFFTIVEYFSIVGLRDTSFFSVSGKVIHGSSSVFVNSHRWFFWFHAVVQTNKCDAVASVVSGIKSSVMNSVNVSRVIVERATDSVNKVAHTTVHQ